MLICRVIYQLKEGCVMTEIDRERGDPERGKA
jgi:hypothetical protein